MINAVNVVGALVAVSVFFVVAQTLSRAAQPLRLRMAELGEPLLADPSLPRKFKRHVAFLLDHAFSMRAVMWASVFLIPALAVISVVRARWLAPFVLDEQELPAKSREDFREVVKLHNRITVANHSIMMPVITIELVLSTWLATVVRGVFRGVIASNADANTVLMVLEEKTEAISARFRHNHAV